MQLNSLVIENSESLVDDTVALYTQTEDDEDYEEENQCSNLEFLRTLRSYEREISLRQRSNKQQVTLDRLFLGECRDF